MSRKVIFAPKEFYHIYNRGTEKRNIFSNQKDYERFKCLLYACNGVADVHLDLINQRKNKRGRTSLGLLLESDRGNPLVDICVYCLMPNHFHLILQEIEEGGISRFMQKLSTGYTMFFNRRHERTGALFQGKFKAIHIDNDTYFKYLISYIHLNPVKIIDPEWKENGIKDRKKAEKYLDTYEHSSYIDYSEKKREEEAIINKSVLPDYHSGSYKDFKSMVTEWLAFSEVEPR